MTLRIVGVLKVVALTAAFLLTVFLTFHLLDINMDINLSTMMAKTMLREEAPKKEGKLKCNLSKACPPRHFAFKLTSGAANVVGPRMCWEDVIVMSNVRNNVGRGLNVILIHGKTGEVFMATSFDMWGGDVAPLIQFLKQITDGTIVMMASYDDMATKLNEEARQLIADLGSSEIVNVSSRDNWIFVGGKGIKTKTPFEQYIKNNKETNKFEGWPAVLEMEGCIPSKQH